MNCTRLDCLKPATHKLRPDYGVPWFGCVDHHLAMADALALGQPQAFTVEISSLDVNTVAGGRF